MATFHWATTTVQNTVFNCIYLKQEKRRSTLSIMNSVIMYLSTCLVGIIPDEFCSSFNMCSSKKCHPRESRIPTVKKNVLHKYVRRTRMIVESRDIALEMSIHDEYSWIIIDLRCVDLFIDIFYSCRRKNMLREGVSLFRRKFNSTHFRSIVTFHKFENRQTIDFVELLGFFSARKFVSMKLWSLIP